jgi:GR25 family glycosyltransferase involved in LPS biosynthesis
MSQTIPKIFIVHYEPLQDRKNYLVKEFEKYGITDYEFVTKYDRDSVDINDLNSNFTEESHKNYSIVAKCVTLTHIYIYQQIIESNLNMALILEDDALLCDNFTSKLQTYLENLPENFDAGFINDGCKFHIPKKQLKPNVIWYENKGTRTCCAYLITNKCCKQMLPYMFPLAKSIDHILGHYFQMLNLNVYWAEPTIVSDGSESVYKVSYVKNALG